MEETHKNDIDAELDWIKLREELEEMRDQDKNYLPYKDNWIVKTGLGLTVLSFAYTLFNMNNDNKMYRGMSYRIMFQTATICAVGIGYYRYTKTPEYAKRKEMFEQGRF